MSALAIVRWNIWSYGSDTGTFAQTIAHTFTGFTNTLEGGTHFRFHFSPLLAILWPLVAVTRSPLSLQIAQVVLIALSVLPLSAIIAKYSSDPWPARCALLAALYPPLLANAFSEFHELAFYPVLALALIWAADNANWLVFAVAALAAVLVREDASVQLIIIGIVLATIGATRRTTRERGLLLGEPQEPERLVVAGATLALLAAATLAIYAWIVLPRIGPWAPSHFYNYPFAHGPVQTAAAIVLHPVPLLHAIATTGRLTYVLEALLPLALLPLFTRWSLLALPAFGAILLASDESVWRMGMHYVLLWAPWFVLAAAWQLGKMDRTGSGDRATLWWRITLALEVIFLIAFNPMHPAHYLRAPRYQHTGQALQTFTCTPKNAYVQTHDEWFAHEALAIPNVAPISDKPLTKPGYIVFAKDWQNSRFARLLPKIQRAESDGTLALACTHGTVTALRSEL